MKRTLLLLSFLPLLMTTTCNKEPKPEPEPQLPPVTTEGANTFGCYINGELWLPGPGRHHCPRVYISPNGIHSMGIFVLTACKVIDKHNFIEQSFSIVFNGVDEEGTYLLSNYVYNEFSGGGEYRDINTDSKICFYKTDSSLTGNLTILKLDKETRIVAGTFEMTVVTDYTSSSNSCKKDTIKITEGRFDIKY